MKILEINPLCGYGCTGRIVTDLQSISEDMGHTCTIAYNREPSSDCSKIRIGNSATLYIHALYTRFFDRQGFCSKRAMRKFLSFVESYKPDIIHFHILHGNYIHLPTLITYINNHQIPVVYTFHDCWAFTGHCVYFDAIDCTKYISGCHKCPKLHQHPASWFIDQSRRNYHEKCELFSSMNNLHIVTPSHWLAGLVKKSFLKEKPIHVIPNGIDTEIFKPTISSIRQQYKSNNKYIILGCSNGWGPTKGLNDFVYLSEQLDMTQYAIILIGLSPKQIKQLPPTIIGIERTDNITQLAEFYSAANVFINPTYEDNFPTTNIEALSCGTPVITYHTGGSPEALMPECGIVVPQGNRLALADAVRTARDSNFTEDACRAVALNYNKKDQYAKYIKLFESLLS